MVGPHRPRLPSLPTNRVSLTTHSSGSSLLLSSLELSDTKVYEPQIRARLGTAAHFCEVGVLKSMHSGVQGARADVVREPGEGGGSEREHATSGPGRRGGGSHQVQPAPRSVPPHTPSQRIPHRTLSTQT